LAIASVIKRSAIPLRPRVIVINTPQHIIQRGNNRQACFYADEDYRFYLEWIKEYADKTECRIHAYVLMTNHVHLLVSTVAGFGTRFLPATKASPKEMLPIVDKPLIQYAAEEAIAAGVQYSVRDFVNTAAKELEMDIHWQGSGVDEKGYLNGKCIVQVDEKYFRPTEVETLLGDSTKAKEKLGWTPKITFHELVAEMVREDYISAQRDELVKEHGFQTMDYHE
jgi:hypothetical protein